jgi:hypothetical protein
MNETLGVSGQRYNGMSAMSLMIGGFGLLLLA